MALYRYPGPKPFTTEEALIFRGRVDDIERLTNLVLQEQLVVLYGQSGLGKSSLLNAGLIPKLNRLRKAGESPYHALSIRFNAWYRGREAHPVQLTHDRLPLPEGDRYLERLIKGDDSLWRHFKDYQYLQPTQSDFVLLFDQFEELFTFPEHMVDDFRDQLTELLNARIPQRYRDALAEKPDALTEAQAQILYEPLNVRVVLAIRSDRLHLMDRLSQKLPAILRERYHLLPLSLKQAEDAILDPAYRQEEGLTFHSPVFDYEDDALDAMLNYLSNNKSTHIESFQLQTLCQYAERSLVMGKGLGRISRSDMGDLSQVFKNYYEDLIDSIGSASEQRAARRLIEEGLVFEEGEQSRRLSLYAGMIRTQYEVQDELLDKLVDSRILRSEPDPGGGFTYELAHDTLMAPILAAKERRLQEEEKLRIEAEAAAKLQEQKKKNRRRLLIALLVIGVGGAILGTFAYQQSVNARKQAKLAEEAADAAEKAIIESQRADSLLLETEKALNDANTAKAEALDATEEANAERKRAEYLLFKTKEALEVADSAKAEALNREREARLAETRAERAQKETAQKLAELEAANAERVKRKLQDVQAMINRRDFEGPEEVLKEAVDLGVAQERVLEGYAELLYFYTEAAELGGGWRVWEQVSPLVQPAGSLKADTLDFLKRQYPSWVSEAYLQALERKYYPDMVRVEGGDFMMGADTAKLRYAGYNWESDELPRHKVRLADYGMGRTELTTLQYYLYTRVRGIEMAPNPSWGYDGKAPVVYVSWEDAGRYCNWLSEKEGLQPVFVFDEEGDWVKVERDANGYRLPSEAEWEYAARGGIHQEGWVFSGSNSLGEVGWYGQNADRTMAVAILKPNALGLYDMSGNVWEWCLDAYDEDFYQICIDEGRVNNPINENYDNLYVVLRGGSWLNNDYNCRVALRVRSVGDNWGSNLGFRVARNLP